MDDRAGTIAEVQAAIEKDRPRRKGRGGRPGTRAKPAGPGGFGRGGGVDIKYYEVIFDKATRDPRGYIIPSDQADFPTAIEVRQRPDQERRRRGEGDKATSRSAARAYPKGSYVV